MVLRIQARDLREQPIATCTHAVGLHRDIPAALLFIQAAQQHIHLPMQLLIWMGRFPASNGDTCIDAPLILAWPVPLTSVFLDALFYLLSSRFTNLVGPFVQKTIILS
jgi:hypothetical protein